MNALKQTIILSVRLGHRAVKQRSKLLLCACIFMCSFIAACLQLFANNVQNALNDDIAHFLGAPLVVRSSAAIPALPPLAAKLGINPPVITHSITTGALSQSAYQSVSLKGVSSDYPLQGQLVVTTTKGEQAITESSSLELGYALLDSRALDELKLSLGDTFQVGKTKLIVYGVLNVEPDRLTQLQHALPRVLVSMPTFKLTEVSNGQNNGEFRSLFSGSKDSLAKLELALPRILNAHDSVLTPNAGGHPFSRISQRAEKMLSVLLVLVLIMCGSAAATLADHSVKQSIQTATVLRCMGVNRNAVSLALLVQLALLAMLSSVLACLIAFAAQPMFNQTMQPHMQLSSTPLSWSLLLQILAIGLLTILVFVAPKLAALSRFPVSQILRGQQPRRSVSFVSLVMVAGLSVGLLYYNSDNNRLTLMMMVAVAALISLSTVFAWCLSKLCAQCHHLFKGTYKVAIRSIGRSPQRHFASLLSISIAMMAILMTVTLRGSFIDLLQNQTIEQDGNYFYTGLDAASKSQFTKALSSHSGELKNMHPTVNAHLLMVNGIYLDDALTSESDTREEARSKVRLSWAESKPNNNKLLDGQWPTLGSNDVSVEAEVMSDLGLALGDVLTFQIGDVQLHSAITSRRQFQAGGSRVMFWFMFAPDTLAPYKQSMMGGFNLPRNLSSEINLQTRLTLGDLATKFPSVRITNLERQITSVRTIMNALTRLMNTALLLLMSGACMLIISSSFNNVVNRESQTVLLRAFGLRTQQLLMMGLIEYIALSAVACAVGIAGVQLIAGTMFNELFGLSYQLEWVQALSLSAAIIGSFAILGLLFNFRSSQQNVRLSMPS